MSLENYRIRRVDPNNITIQKQHPNKRWRSISYHGNSPHSLACGLLELATKQIAPSDSKTLESLESIKLEIVSMRDDIERMIVDAKICE